jgi:hypothetical protein
MTEQKEAISCIFPHSDEEFGVTKEGEWTKEERISFNRGALRGYLSDILPNRGYAYHYAVHYEMTDDNEDKVKATWRDHRMLFPVPNHLLTNDSRVYFFYKWEIVGDGIVEKVLYNNPDSEYSGNWNPEMYPLIVKFKRNSIRIYPHDSISKSVMKRALTAKTMKTLPMGYPILSDTEEHALRKEVNAAVKTYSSEFI